MNVKITVRDIEGNILDVQEFHNLLTNAGFNEFRDGLYGDAIDLEISHLAVGDDDGSLLPLAVTNTTLGNELDRYATTDHDKSVTAQHWHIVYIPPADSVGWIRELGWFCDAGGIMISRIFYERNKTAVESLQVERTDTITEV